MTGLSRWAVLLSLTLSLTVGMLSAGCLGTIKHKRCKKDFDGCSNRCETLCEREGSATNDPYRGDDPGGIREFNLECADCVRDCHGKAEVCDTAEERRYRALPPDPQ